MDYSDILSEISVGKRYVYFQSLLDHPNGSPYYKIGKQAQAALGEFKSDISLSQNGTEKPVTKMDQALQFLKTAAAYERAKELRFFQNFQQMHPETVATFNLNLNNIDYVTFIANINQALKGTLQFKKELDYEYDRIKRYRTYDEKLEKKEINKDQYYELLNNDSPKERVTNTYFKLDGNTTFNSIIDNRSNMSILSKIIIENYGAQLFMLQGNHIKLKPAMVAALIKVLADKLYQMILIEYGRVSNTDNKLYERASKLALKNNDYIKFINNILDNPGLYESLYSIADQHDMIPGKPLNQLKETDTQIKELTQRMKVAYEKINNPTLTFEQFMEQNDSSLNPREIIRAIHSVRSQAYYSGEDFSLTDLLGAHIFGTLGGRSNPTDDIEAGKLIIVMEDQTKVPSEVMRKEEQKLARLQKEYFDKISRTTDLKSFQENTAILRELRNKQQQQLKLIRAEINKTEQGLKYLLKHINIHDTVKGYTSAGRSSFERYKGFEGAAFGSNLDEQLKLITSLEASGSFSNADINWLKFAMVNAGQKMIGHKLKSSLEDYFSVFVGFFMFNDAAIMVEDAMNFMTNQTLTDQGIADLHVYQLNGVFIPSSYLLEHTYQSLMGVEQDINGLSNDSQRTKAILHTYDSGPLNDWNKTAEAAKEQTKLEMKFLSGFFDLLEKIQNKMNNI